ncbi:MAG: hypothetical protein JWL77_573 [Chthonomonadaceae bacterium]|nr:hypothetical protein [Chthonomonadaceae bacterium]
MKTVKILFYILLTVVGVVLIAYLLAATVGMLMYIGIAVAILGIVVAIVRYGIRKHHERTHPLRQHARAVKAADRALKDIERTINKQ